MLVMINGPFGVGKSTVAKGLVSRLENSLIFDPEMVGSFVRVVTLSVEEAKDYQDIALWRSLTFQTAKGLHENYGRNLIVPMTIANTTYFGEIREGFRQIDSDLYHFCLMASTQTIHNRLEKRGEKAGAWPFQQMARCQQAFQSAQFAEHIDTENSSADEIIANLYDRLSGS